LGTQVDCSNTQPWTTNRLGMGVVRSIHHVTQLKFFGSIHSSGMVKL